MRLFVSSEVLAILNMPQRRLTHIAEKKIVVPVVDALGAGSRRLWSYENLLEIGLSELLFKIRFSLHLVMEILQDLRQQQSLKLWASDFDAFFEEFARRQRGWIENEKKKNPTQTEEALIQQLKPPTSEGILFRFYNVEGPRVSILIPLPFKQAIESLPGLAWFMEKSMPTFFVDIGRMKRGVDSMIRDLGLVVDDS